MSIYYLSNTNSDLTGGADFSKAIVKVAPTAAAVSVPLAIGATETSYAWTEAGEPGTSGATGNYTIQVTITTGSTAGRLSISVTRVNSAGTAQVTSAATAEQTTSAGTLTFTLTAINLGTWASGDRLRVNYIFRNSSAMTAITLGVQAGYNSSTGPTSVDVPWTLTPPSPLYWVGGTGSWTQGLTATARNWAASSGGTPLDFVPESTTDVVFDGASDVGSGFTVTLGTSITLGSAVAAANVTVSGLDNAMVLAGTNLYVSGNLTLPSTNFSFGGTPGLLFNAASPTIQAVNVGGVVAGTVTKNGSGTVQLANNLTVSNPIVHNNGGFDANGFNVTCTSFNSSVTTARTLSMGSGTWTLTGTGTVWNFTATGLTFNKGTANIVLSNNSTSTRTFTGAGLTYNKLTIGGSTSTSTTAFTGSNTFSELASTKTVAHTVQFAAGTTTTVSAWAINGSAGNVVNLRSSVAGTRFTLNLL